MRTLLAILCLALASCSPAQDAPDVDTSRDVEVSSDVRLADVDTSLDVESNADVQANADVALIPDAAPADVVVEDFGPVQCRVTEDCGDAQLQCNRAAPGASVMVAAPNALREQSVASARASACAKSKAIATWDFAV